MKSIATFFLSISLLLLSLTALAGPPADAGVERTYVTGEDDWAVTNPISLGTILCPGGELAFDAVGMPFCANSNTGRLHYRDAVFWACVTADDPRMTGIAYYEIWGNWDAESTGPVGGTWKIFPTRSIEPPPGTDPPYRCNKFDWYPADLLTNASEYWSGTWTGKRSFQEQGFWLGEFKIVGKGYGELEGLHFKGEEIVPTFTPFPVPYEFLQEELPYLYNVAEGTLTGIITE